MKIKAEISAEFDAASVEEIKDVIECIENAVDTLRGLGSAKGHAVIGDEKMKM